MFSPANDAHVCCAVRKEVGLEYGACAQHLALVRLGPCAADVLGNGVCSSKLFYFSLMLSIVLETYRECAMRALIVQKAMARGRQ